MNLSLQDLGILTEEASKVNLFHLMPGRSEAKHRGIDGTWFANGAEAGVFVDFDSDILFFEQHQIIFWQVQWPVLFDTWCPCWQSDFGPPIAQRQTMMEMDLWCLLEFSV